MKRILKVFALDFARSGNSFLDLGSPDREGLDRSLSSLAS
jgi:hypothetical protein